MRSKVLLLIFISLSFASCKKWLDVKPTAQMSESELFSNEQGFRDVMRGVYTKAAQRKLYGEMLTVSLMDVLARRYDNVLTNTFHDFYPAATFNYSETSMQTNISAIWSEMYGGIAQLNLLLKHIDGAKQLFASEQSFQRLKGEALGMRAFLHFDLLRMFAASYTADANAKAIPYVKDFSVKPSASLTTTQVIDNCISDLKSAEEVLKNDSTTGDSYNFSLWAIRATMARVYLYKGDASNALSYADKVISSTLFRFVSAAEINASKPFRVLPSECIFSLYSYDLNATSDTYFTPTANGATLPNYHYLFLTEAKLNSIYETNVQGYGADPRVKLWWELEAGSTTRFLAKFRKVDNVIQYRMPVIRLSEMYLIAAEAATDVATAKKYLDGFRVTGRYLPAFTGTTIEDVNAVIAKEYAKEYFGEGQLFYYYKRKNITIPGAGISGNALFVFPMPQNEIEFR
ncbi:RagB/SusD family nutrient uptake outer membrane protein [Chitinophaga silvatica]|uniref:RagB/SusD family nutrient uptake outer membrane protein n=1 Tax=Chitinophaga silvatica TaxID=2282649 RepID=A0A3E1Y6X0_9BACT|nr:RagB/SusD family nutrient uptake outer membrane protein [Chitinophaga silvatica]RFS20685.1 RagB/SusD family nutrient uptake outer membrane protein [Chitinophaga silvatica]